MGRFNPFPFIGGSYTDDALSWAHQDTVNYMPVLAERAGTRSPAKLAMVPGMRAHGIYGTEPHRGGRDVEGQRYVVAGTKLYKLKADGTGTQVGTIPGTGRVQMTHNQITGGNQLFIATGSSGYVYNTYTGALTQVTDDAFPGAKSCDFLGQYVIGVEPFGRYWFHSALADATSYNALDVFQAETNPDGIMGLIASHNEVLVFGRNTIEPWSNSPTENAAFQLQTGSVIETGCASGDTICRLDNSVFFLTDKGQVAKLEGYTPRIISTYAMEGAIRECDLSRAFAFTWEDKGHTVYYLTFPDGHTWGYDVRQGEWHRRESYGHDRWRLNTLFKSNGKWYGGDFQNGNLYQLDWSYALDGCDPIERYRTGSVVHDSGERVTVNALQVVVNSGAAESDCYKLPPDELLITGAAKGGGAPSFNFARVVDGTTPTISGLPMATGADISAAVPAFNGGDWVVATASQVRHASTLTGSWAPGSIAADNQVVALMHSDGGWAVSTGNGIPCSIYTPPALSTTLDFSEGFGSSLPNAIVLTNDPNPAAGRLSQFYSSSIGWSDDGYAYRAAQFMLFRSANPASGEWQILWESINGVLDATLLRIYDTVKVGSTTYGLGRRGYYASIYQIRTSPDGGVTWPDGGVLWEQQDVIPRVSPTPYEIISCAGFVVVACSDGTILTSANGWSAPITTGMGMKAGAYPYAEDRQGGRQMAVAGGKVYIIGSGVAAADGGTGDQVVVFDPITLAVSGPYTLPVYSAWGIASNRGTP